MKRLTDRNLPMLGYMHNNRGLKCYLELLAEYKDTGLTPEEIKTLKAERDSLARYISSLDIDEAVCKKNLNCKAEWERTKEDCIICIINTLGHGLEAEQWQ